MDYPDTTVEVYILIKSQFLISNVINQIAKFKDNQIKTKVVLALLEVQQFICDELEKT